MFSRVALLGCCAAAALVSATEGETARFASEHIELASEEGGVGANGVTASVGLSFSLMHDGMPAWEDLAGSAATDPPLSIAGIPSAVPNKYIKPDSVTSFTCPPTAVGLGQDHCHAWVWVYSCPWSCPVEADTSLGPMLKADGWQWNLCAPRFLTGASPYKHRMVAYRYHLAPGGSVSFTTSAKVQNVMFGVELAMDCTVHLDSPTCKAVPNEKCQWRNGACEAQTCKGPGQGPPPPCLECA